MPVEGAGQVLGEKGQYNNRTQRPWQTGQLSLGMEVMGVSFSLRLNAGYGLNRIVGRRLTKGLLGGVSSGSLQFVYFKQSLPFRCVSRPKDRSDLGQAILCVFN